MCATNLLHYFFAKSLSVPSLCGGNIFEHYFVSVQVVGIQVGCFSFLLVTSLLD